MFYKTFRKMQRHMKYHCVLWIKDLYDNGGDNDEFG